MRFRPLSVPRALRRTADVLRPSRAGLAGPLAVAVALAVVGHEVSAPAVPSAVAVPYRAAEVVQPERLTVERAATPTRASVVREQPKKKAAKRPRRASRARVRKAVRGPNWVRPSRGALTSGYGPRWGRMHRGIDFGASYGSPIYAAATGHVTFAGPEGGYGRLVTIRHATGITTAYGHMSRIVVRRGQRVTAGQVIAYVGSAGRSTGPHLHFEVRRGGSFLNPIPFLRSRGVRV